MKWYSVKKYTPYNDIGVCLVMTENDDVTMATFGYWSHTDQYLWLSDIDAKPLEGVTHFCIPEPVEIEE